MPHGEPRPYQSDIQEQIPSTACNDCRKLTHAPTSTAKAEEEPTPGHEPAGHPWRQQKVSAPKKRCSCNKKVARAKHPVYFRKNGWRDRINGVFGEKTRAQQLFDARASKILMHVRRFFGARAPEFWRTCARILAHVRQNCGACMLLSQSRCAEE